MPVSDVKIRDAVNELEGNLIPENLKPIVQPPERIMPKTGGRPKKDELVKLAEKVSAARTYYLNNAYNILLRNTVQETPVICIDECPYEYACTLKEEQRPRSMENGHPDTGQRCPIEYDLILTAFYGYITELEIDETRPTEVQTAAKLAGIQVYLRRIDTLINDQGIVIEQGVGVTKSGEAVIRHEEHPLLKVREKFESREAAILKQFHATREQSEKAKREQNADKMFSVDQWLSKLVIDGEYTVIEDK